MDTSRVGALGEAASRRSPNNRFGDPLIPLVAGPGSDCADGEAAIGETEREEEPRFFDAGAPSSAAMLNKCVFEWQRVRFNFSTEISMICTQRKIRTP